MKRRSIVHLESSSQNEGIFRMVVGKCGWKDERQLGVTGVTHLPPDRTPDTNRQVIGSTGQHFGITRIPRYTIHGPRVSGKDSDRHLLSNAVDVHFVV